MNIIFPLFLLTASFMAQAAQTPPEYDPDSLVCPGKCVGSYTNTEFANNNCFGTIGSCVCIGTLTKPPLGNLTACLEGTTCSMSADDARTYIDGLLKFEGCSSSAQSAFEASSTAGGQGATGAGDSTAPPQASQSHNAGWTYMVASHGGGWALGVALVGLYLTADGLISNISPHTNSRHTGLRISSTVTVLPRRHRYRPYMTSRSTLVAPRLHHRHIPPRKLWHLHGHAVFAQSARVDFCLLCQVPSPPFYRSFSHLESSSYSVNLCAHSSVPHSDISCMDASRESEGMSTDKTDELPRRNVTGDIDGPSTSRNPVEDRVRYFVCRTLVNARNLHDMTPPPLVSRASCRPHISSVLLVPSPVPALNPSTNLIQ
ncbi:hypothetical protein C8J57DRAFT_1510954 [Mycena rebaudengoi]|nr:hypothetical protein C8J57DRAFT_1510954 [Mycena rebaudengoi]